MQLITASKFIIPLWHNLFKFILLERRKAEKADNARERALEKMMAGRLETNLEEELKKELVKPEFMSKPDSEWTEEEQKAAKEFEKKQLKVSFAVFKFTSSNTP